MSISVLIVDDEAISRARIRRYLREAPDTEVIAECDNGRDAIEAVATWQPDLLFLDVEMPELDGFATVQQLDPDCAPLVVFVTAYDEYALRAFDVNAVDYLLKPFDRERFDTALTRARQRLVARAASAVGHHAERMGEEPHLAETSDRAIGELVSALRAERLALEALVAGVPAVVGGPVRYVERFAVRNDGRISLVRVADVDWIEAAGNYVKLYTGHGIHLVRDSLASLDTRLDPHQFVRVHRRAIVNLDRVKEIQPWFSGDYIVVLRNSTARVRLSRSYRDAVLERVGCR